MKRKIEIRAFLDEKRHLREEMKSLRDKQTDVHRKIAAEQIIEGYDNFISALEWVLNDSASEGN